MKPTWCYCFFFFFTHPTQNQSEIIKLSSSRAKTKSRQSLTWVKYRGIIICIKINIYLNTSDLKILQKIFLQIRLIFQTLSSISTNFHIVCLPPNAWLNSYDRYGSFGTMIWGSLIVSPVLWVLSSHNTISVTHSDTALQCLVLSKKIYCILTNQHTINLNLWH